MSEFSFEKYMGDAVLVERSAIRAGLPIDAMCSDLEKDPTLEAEALAVAQAIGSIAAQDQDAAEFTIVTAIPVLTGYEKSGGWNLTKLAPVINPTETDQPRLSLDYLGGIFHYRLSRLGALIAVERYFPDHGTVIGNETIRYGLARLVARHLGDTSKLAEELPQV